MHKDRESRATVIETGVHHRSVQKLVRLKCILSCQLQDSPLKLRIPVMSSIDSDHPLISGRHAPESLVGMGWIVQIGISSARWYPIYNQGNNLNLEPFLWTSRT